MRNWENKVFACELLNEVPARAQGDKADAFLLRALRVEPCAPAWVALLPQIYKKLKAAISQRPIASSQPSILPPPVFENPGANFRATVDTLIEWPGERDPNRCLCFRRPPSS